MNTTTNVSRIKCNRCYKIKPLASFASNRINDVKEKVTKEPRFNPIVTEYVPCTMCVGGQVTELECCMCKKWMGLDKFSKVQRRTPDRAVSACLMNAVDLE